MKTRNIYISLISLAAAASVAVGSCEKPVTPPDPDEGKTVALTVIASVKPLEGGSSSEINWGGQEQMVLLASDSSDDSILNGSGEDGSFVFELPSVFSGKELTLGAFYPASAAVAGDNGNPEDYRVTLPAEQTPGEWSWDPSAELFASARGSLTLDKNAESAEWNADFRRLVAINHLILNGFNGEISKVEITAPANVSLAGESGVDLFSGTAGEITEGSNRITLNYSPAIASEGSANIWFCSWGAEIPAGAEISVTVNGSTGTVVSAGEDGLRLAENSVNLLTAEFESGGEVVPPVEDELTGRWLVGAQDGDGRWVLMTSTIDDQHFDELQTDVTGDVWSLGGGNFEDEPGIEDCIWTIAPCGDGYSLRNANDGYLEIYSEKKVREASTPVELDMVRNSDGSVTISSPGNSGWGTLRYNVSSPRFTTYTSTGSSLPLVSLIPWDGETRPMIVIDEPSQTVAADATSVSFKYTTAGLSSSVNASVTSDPDGMVVTHSAASGILRVSLSQNGSEEQRQAVITLYADGVSADARITQLGKPGEGGGEGGGGEIESGWLELPKPLGTEEYVKTFYAGGERNYSYGYDVDWYTSMWVAYPLYADAMGSGRSDNWAPNPDIPEREQINVWNGSYGVNYGSTIYSRGHQIANGDRNGNSSMQRQTFYATNSTPQIQDNFNGGIWNKLENAIQDLAGGRDTVYVATGPVFQTVGGNEDVKWIQPKHDSKQAPVPNYYWKAVLKVKRSGGKITDASAVGFWFEHRQYSDSYEKYAVSVDEIERKTGLDLFVNLPDSVEAKAETNTSWTTFRNF